MKVFAINFLESASNDEIGSAEWKWSPVNPDVKKIYGSGAATGTRESTYVSEKDDRSDSDRPNEGMLATAA